MLLSAVVDAVRIELGLDQLSSSSLPTLLDMRSAVARGQIAIAKAVDVNSIPMLWAETTSLNTDTEGLNKVGAMRLVEAERNGVPCAEVSTTQGVLSKRPGSMHEAGPGSPVIYRSGVNWVVVPSLAPDGAGKDTVQFRAVYVKTPAITTVTDDVTLDLDENFHEPLVAFALGVAYRQLKLSDLMQIADQRFQATLGLSMQSEATDAQ